MQLGGGLQPQDLLALPRYCAYARLLVDGLPSQPFSMQTLATPPANRRDARRPEVIRRVSRHRYARPASDVRRQVEGAFAGA